MKPYCLFAGSSVTEGQRDKKRPGPVDQQVILSSICFFEKVHIKASSPHTKRQNQLQWWGSGSQVNCTITFAAPPRRPGACLFRPTSICQEGQWADVPGLGRSGNQLLCPKQNAPGSWTPGSQARQSLASDSWKSTCYLKHLS